MDRWVERIAAFFDLPREAISVGVDDPRKPNGLIDVAKPPVEIEKQIRA